MDMEYGLAWHGMASARMMMIVEDYNLEKSPHEI